MVKREAELEAEIAAIRANVRALLEEAEAVDAEEDECCGPDRRGDELPEELRRREQRLAKIREAKQALEDEAAARERARRAELESDSKKPRRPPNGRDPFKPKPKAQRNFTDRVEDHEDRGRRLPPVLQRPDDRRRDGAGDRRLRPLQ